MTKKDKHVAPVWRLRKDDIVRIGRWRCKHSHTGLEHYSCWLKENPDQERVGFIDIEASNLKGDFGIVICYSILDLNSDTQIARVVTKEELFDYSHDPDYHLMRDCVKDMMMYDRLIGYYSGDYKFDIPFLRTRAVSQSIEFPGVGSIFFEDVYTTIKKKFCLSSNRLATAVRTLTGDTQKTNWFQKYWVRGIQGDPSALAYIVDHCEKDVQDLKKLYLKVYPFVQHKNQSI